VTYSIVARDAETGELGVAVQSQAFNTGAAVGWARPGVGAIATQSFTDRRYGFRGLELLAADTSPQEALDELRAADPLPGLRQVAFMGADGTTAQWTGEHCIPSCGHTAGTDWAAQGNMLAAEAWHAMGRAFEAATGPLAQRLLAALEAAEADGGDFRGRGGAGIVIVPAEGEPWERAFDLRVEDGDDSLVELRRLVEVAEGYRAAHRASPMAPIARERGVPAQHVLWLSLMDAAAAADVAEGRRILDELAALHPHWVDAARGSLHHPDSPPALRDIVGD
jgi:uncharacterized Ntn-hydrolase superfamily protein